MATHTLVEPLTEMGVAAISAAPCHWHGCTARPTHRVYQTDTVTRQRDSATLHYMCTEHAQLISAMVQETER